MWEERTQTAASPNGKTVIGKTMVINGSIETTGDLYVDGVVTGKLMVVNSRLTIGPNGRAKANATARDVDVIGALDGNVESSGKVSVQKGGRLVGDVRTVGIVIEDGAHFKGGIDILTRQPDKTGEA